MNATLPRSDEDFARTLRDRLDAAAPMIDVDTSRVVPAARRTRRKRRATALVAGLALLGAGGVGWSAQPWAVEQEPEILPATNPSSTPPDGSPAPTLGPSWPDAPYWHVRREINEVESNGDAHVNVLDEWFGNERPGLTMNDGDLESAWGIGLHPWGRELLLDGERVDLGWDTFYALPTDPAELETVLRDSVPLLYPADNAREDVVLQIAGYFIGRTPAPPALRDALWTVMTNQPAVTVLGEVRDTQGRIGVGLESVITVGGEEAEPVQTVRSRYVYDPVERRLLEVSATTTSAQPGDFGEVVFTAWDTYLEEGPADALPKEPSPEDLGCVSWENC